MTEPLSRHGPSDRLPSPISKEKFLEKLVATKQAHDQAETAPAPVEPTRREECAVWRIGEEMSDGAIYAGISPDTGNRMYADPIDAPLICTFNGAAEFAERLNSQNYLGHNDWRVPTKSELNVLFNNRAAIGGLDVSGAYPAGWYWSSSPFNGWLAWGQRFSDGFQGNNDKNDLSSVRCVR